MICVTAFNSMFDLIPLDYEVPSDADLAIAMAQEAVLSAFALAKVASALYADVFLMEVPQKFIKLQFFLITRTWR